MKIFDVHNHIIFRFSGDTEDLSSFLSKAENLGITLTGITLNTTIKDIQKEVLRFKKEKREDPYLRWNIYMMESLRLKKQSVKVFPFLYLPPEKRLAEESMKVYEKRFGDQAFGYKVHSQGIRENIRSLEGINSSRPIIIHSSVDYSAPKDIIDTFSSYKGNILLAHFAKFDLKSLKKIRNLKHFFIDSSVAILMFEALRSNSTRVFRSKEFSELSSPEEMYVRVADICGRDKIIFATDYPLSETQGGGYEKETEILRNLPEGIKERIAYKNALNFLNLE